MVRTRTRTFIQRIPNLASVRSHRWQRRGYNTKTSRNYVRRYARRTFGQRYPTRRRYSRRY